MNRNEVALVEELRKRIDRLYSGLWAIGVAAGVLAGFGISLRFDLVEAKTAAGNAEKAAVKAEGEAKTAATAAENARREAEEAVNTAVEKRMSDVGVEISEMADASVKERTSPLGSYFFRIPGDAKWTHMPQLDYDEIYHVEDTGIKNVGERFAGISAWRYNNNLITIKEVWFGMRSDDALGTVDNDCIGLRVWRRATNPETDANCADIRIDYYDSSLPPRD